MAKKWEYLVVTAVLETGADEQTWRPVDLNGNKQATAEPVHESLDAWGEHGWELVSVVQSGPEAIRLFLKRPR
jgi:hypothetical protein